ncbi:hypothetical protein MS2017_0472 [Bathymodiolus thermophilus thioautotrophic gill symbiont]|uniref:DUF4935 domain-containing protein n=1 Tax=Bathymodiolus thermophilus thioautotrophic gill symbiont TaxID=2360 RepID=A0A3G3IK44_9GAMM|nr:PIN domain-containing protein [Bathymodiolus thermophilus thioautotrophic gill symbiont]AYQ56215.1 hypothetical protein MS2017_0472 [Bathymodiolus thermophilus thioautotrophic gill symbiont]
MIHVILDTNIYRKNPNRENLDFKALEELAKANSIRLHIPYVVLREFQTQQKEIYLKAHSKVISGLSKLSEKQLNTDILNKLEILKDLLEDELENTLSNTENQITNWANNIGANLYPLCLEQANAALEAYFQGTPPLKSIKKREDIPDSFIVQSIFKLNKENNDIHVVSGDNKIKDTFSNEGEITTYNSLSDFIKSDLIQAELKDTDFIISQLIEAIRQHEKKCREITNFISNNIGETIMWKTFTDQSIPDDNNEATISGYEEVEHIDLDFSEIRYYGNGQFGIPFNLTITVSAYYYIFKSDYYMISDEEHAPPSVTDHNDHYFEAEDEFKLNVVGLASISLNINNINLENISEYITKYNIDEITDIEKY